LDEEFFSATVLCLILSYHAAPYPIIVMWGCCFSDFVCRHVFLWIRMTWCGWYGGLQHQSALAMVADGEAACIVEQERAAPHSLGKQSCNVKFLLLFSGSFN
jgi:hypothetical protein